MARDQAGSEERSWEWGKQGSNLRGPVELPNHSASAALVFIVRHGLRVKLGLLGVGLTPGLFCQFLLVESLLV